MSNSIAAAHRASEFLRQRDANETERLDRVRVLADRVARSPLSPVEPIGESRLAGPTFGVTQSAELFRDDVEGCGLLLCVSGKP